MHDPPGERLGRSEQKAKRYGVEMADRTGRSRSMVMFSQRVQTQVRFNFNEQNFAERHFRRVFPSASDRHLVISAARSYNVQTRARSQHFYERKAELLGIPIC